MSGADQQLTQQSTVGNETVGETGKIEIGQSEQGAAVEADIPRLEGKQLMRVVNSVIRNAPLAFTLERAEKNVGIAEVYKIGLQYPDQIDADNIRKLYQTPVWIAATGKAFQELRDNNSDPSRGYHSDECIEHKRAYAAHAVERFGRYSPQGRQALIFAHGSLTEEFREEHDVPLDPLELESEASE